MGIERQSAYAVFNEWDKETRRYVSAGDPQELSNPVPFGEIELYFGQPRSVDIGRNGPGLVLRKRHSGPIRNKMTVIVERLPINLSSSLGTAENPESETFIIGEEGEGGILFRANEFFLGQLENIYTLEIFDGEPESHPSMLQIGTNASFGENGGRLQ